MVRGTWDVEMGSKFVQYLLYIYYLLILLKIKIKQIIINEEV